MNTEADSVHSNLFSRVRSNAQTFIAIALLVAVVFIATYPKLTPGVCSEDSGDLQLAAATFGIMHPPGYPIYASIAWPATLLYKSNPARAVTIFCLLFGCVALSLGMLIQVRLGVNPWIACAMMMLFSAHSRIWINLFAPEVYILSLGFLAAAVYAMLCFSRSGSRRQLIVSAMTLGVAVASRPPLILAIPFFIAAWWFAERKFKSRLRIRIRNLGLSVIAVCLPEFYATAYLFIRDTPSNPHNFIDEQIEIFDLPKSSGGVGARIERVYWEASAKLFHKFVGDEFSDVQSGRDRWLQRFHTLRSKARWTEREIFNSVALLGYSEFPEDLVCELSLMVLTAVGMVFTFQIFAPAGTTLLGVATASLIYVLQYRVHGQAADLLPLVFVSAIWLGVVTVKLHIERWDRFASVLPIAIAIIVAVWTFYDSPFRLSGATSRDATSFINEIDVGTLPKDAVIITTWADMVPLKYATMFISPRPDISVIPTAMDDRWIPVSKKFSGRPIFLEDIYPNVKRCRTTPFRSLLLLDPESCPDQGS